MATETIPLSADVRASYEDVYAKNQAAINSTNDFELLKSLNESQTAIGNLLSADDQYRIHADDAKYKEILAQLAQTNAGLDALQNKIAGIAGEFGVLADVVGAITKLLTIVPGL